MVPCDLKEFFFMFWQLVAEQIFVSRLQKENSKDFHFKNLYWEFTSGLSLIYLPYYTRERKIHMKSNNLKQKKWDEWRTGVGSCPEPLTHPDSSEACSLFDTFNVISTSQQHKGVKDVSISADINTACVGKSWTPHCPNGFSTHLCF